MTHRPLTHRLALLWHYYFDWPGFVRRYLYEKVLKRKPKKYETPLIQTQENTMRIKTISMICGAVLSVAAVGTLIGIKEVPRPAWSNELIRVASDVTELDSRVTAQQLDDAKLRYYQNQREQSEYPRANVPDYLIDEQILLERRMDELEDRLDDLRSDD